MGKAATKIDTISKTCIAVRMRLLNRVVTNLYDDALRPFGLKVSQLLIAVWSGATFADWEGATGSCQARRMGRQQGGVGMVIGRSVHRRREASDRICR